VIRRKIIRMAILWYLLLVATVGQRVFVPQHATPTANITVHYGHVPSDIELGA
jgi:hypothetical protein